MVPSHARIPLIPYPALPNPYALHQIIMIITWLEVLTLGGKQFGVSSPCPGAFRIASSGALLCGCSPAEFGFRSLRRASSFRASRGTYLDRPQIRLVKL